MKKERITEILDIWDSIKSDIPSTKDDEKSESKDISKVELMEKYILALINKVNKYDKLSKKFDKIEELENDNLTLVADKQNLVKRFQDDVYSAKKYGGEKLAIELLPVIDMFKRVVRTPQSNEEIQKYLSGFDMIINKIEAGLSSSGVSEIATKPGDDFNPDIHMGIEQVESKDFEQGKVVEVVSTGYKLYDRVIKHTAVKVAK